MWREDPTNFPRDWGPKYSSGYKGVRGVYTAKHEIQKKITILELIFLASASRELVSTNQNISCFIKFNYFFKQSSTTCTN